MATIEQLHTGNGSTTNYSFTFPYLKQADVKVTLDGTATTAFTFANATTLSFTSAPANNVAIRIYRDTDVDTLKAQFFPGSAIKAQDLNDNFDQNNYAVQESKAQSAQAPTALANSVTAISTANTASANATAALNAVNNVVSAQIVANPAALAVLNTSGLSASDQVEIANSTAIESYNTLYSSAPQISGLPGALVGAADITVRLAWSGSAWNFESYSVSDPDGRYLTSTAANAAYQPLDTDTAKTDVTQTFTKAQRGDIVDVTGTTPSFDLNAANNFRFTTSGNWTSFTLANLATAAEGQTGSIFIAYTGAHSGSFPTTMKFVGGASGIALTSINTAIDRIDYIVLNSTTVTCNFTANYVA